MIGVGRGSGERADAARGFAAVDAGQCHVDEHDIVAALNRRDRFLAGADKVGAVTEFGENGVEDDAAVRIVLRAQNRQARRAGAAAAACGAFAAAAAARSAARP